jgi:hypothetical protein
LLCAVSLMVLEPATRSAIKAEDVAGTIAGDG